MLVEQSEGECEEGEQLREGVGDGLVDRLEGKMRGLSEGARIEVKAAGEKSRGIGLEGRKCVVSWAAGVKARRVKLSC